MVAPIHISKKLSSWDTLLSWNLNVLAFVFRAYALKVSWWFEPFTVNSVGPECLCKRYCAFVSIFRSTVCSARSATPGKTAPGFRTLLRALWRHIQSCKRRWNGYKLTWDRKTVNWTYWEEISESLVPYDPKTCLLQGWGAWTWMRGAGNESEGWWEGKTIVFPSRPSLPSARLSSIINLM